MEMRDGFPRRNNADHTTPAEKALSNALYAIEAAGAHTLLTEASELLQQARNKVSDWVELPK